MTVKFFLYWKDSGVIFGLFDAEPLSDYHEKRTVGEYCNINWDMVGDRSEPAGVTLDNAPYKYVYNSTTETISENPEYKVTGDEPWLKG